MKAKKKLEELEKQNTFRVMLVGFGKSGLQHNVQVDTFV